MNIFSLPGAQPYGIQLGGLFAPLIAELCQPAYVNRLTGSENGYRAYLRALHGAIRDAFGFIDWDLLESHGLPDAAQRRAYSARILEDMQAISGASGREVGPKPSVRATFGVSLGMLYSIEEGARAGRRMSRLASSYNVLVLENERLPVPSHAGMESPSQCNRLDSWESDLSLTEIHRDEVQFAARACVEFARRHFSFQCTE